MIYVSLFSVREQKIYIHIILIIIMRSKTEAEILKKEIISMSESSEVVLWMEACAPERLTANKVMLCTRNIFLLQNMRDICPDEYFSIIESSSSAGIVKL